MKYTTEETNLQDNPAVSKEVPTHAALVDQLEQTVLVVTFDKKDGAERVMTCTKSLAVIPTENHPGNTKAAKEGLINVWDTTAQGWRSFYYNRVKVVSLENRQN